LQRGKGCPDGTETVDMGNSTPRAMQRWWRDCRRVENNGARLRQGDAGRLKPFRAQMTVPK
jgi:hypothetical protein